MPKRAVVFMNEAGARLATHLRSGVEEDERIIEQVRGLASRVGQQVHLACPEDFVGGLLPPVIKTFRASFPMRGCS